MVPPGPFALPGDEALRHLIEQLTDTDRGRAPLGDLVASSTADLLSVASSVTPVVASTAAAETLRARFDTVATLIDAGLPTRAYAVDRGSFDTHAGQLSTHASLLTAPPPPLNLI